uniref:Uncharacterized protein n=1 Tax=Timema genevievae TaxID=629358 RepID=A0A7R9K479_TIMGE|nr:unnamed protein product [Timema genevievae]
MTNLVKFVLSNCYQTRDGYVLFLKTQIYQIMKHWFHIMVVMVLNNTSMVNQFILVTKFVQEEPYQGALTGNTHSELGVGGSVVIHLCLKKKVGGPYSQLAETNSGITLLRCHDNNIVTVAFILRGSKPIGKARRQSHKEKKQIHFDQPACIFKYNCYKGGVDRLNQNILPYKVNYSIRVAPRPLPKTLKKRLCSDVQLDGFNHVIVKSMTQV